MNTMTATHKPSMNLRFVEREITVPQPDLGPDIATICTVRVLQQMMVPKDYWSKHDEFWQDVPLYDEADLRPNAQ